MRKHLVRNTPPEYPQPLPQPHPPYRGVCGLRNAGTDTRTPASSASSAKWFVAGVAEGKRSISTTVPNVPGLNYEHKKPRVLGGSHENALELVKTLTVIFLIVNFPAQGSQNPNEFALSAHSKTHLKFYGLVFNLVRSGTLDRSLPQPRNCPATTLSR